LKLKYDELVSNVAYNCNLRPSGTAAAVAAVLDSAVDAGDSEDDAAAAAADALDAAVSKTSSKNNPAGTYTRALVYFRGST